MNLLLLTLAALASDNVCSAFKWVMSGQSEEADSGIIADNPAHLSELNNAGSCYCGVANAGYSDRVVGGDSSLVGEWPWQVVYDTFTVL